MRRASKTVPILLAIAVTFLAIWFLKATKVITMPLAFAFFIAVLVYPLQRWFNRYLPKWLSMLLVMLLLAGIFSLGIGALVLSAEIVAPKLPEYAARFQEFLQTITSWAQQRGLPVGQGISSASLNQIAPEAFRRLGSLTEALSLFVLVVAMLILLLLEVSEYRRKIKRGFSHRMSDKLIYAVEKMSGKLRRYILIQSFTSLLTGIFTALWCWIVGVDFAFVWGLVSFVLNFVPTIGSIIAVLPPTLLALIFNGFTTGLFTLAGLAVIQWLLGNIVDPRLQGRSLQLSPFVALVSIVFWGWVWGVGGALIAVPMTVSIVVLCLEFKQTREIALLLGDANTWDEIQDRNYS
ncbi:MAG: AI-2E family transporter [Oscillatoria sp. PMC 1051.18]|nr:AI-2E family transporter [Oscillatoria sp. PMC 1050.18]MEC5030884.1 AI-2E family transporter [Oscillatoria sp. PMC 1051.18]